MIKVLYVADNLKQKFGVTSVILNYLEQISDENIKIDILAYEDSEREIIERIKQFGSEVYFMPELGLKSIAAFYHYIKLFFAEHQYAIVHSHFNQVDSLIFPIARRAGVRFCISHSHNTKLSNNRLKAIRNRILCWNIGWNADVLAACSEKAGIALYGSWFKNSKKKLIINNGVNLEKFSYSDMKRKVIRDEFGVENSECLIGHIGSFNVRKNQKYLVRIFSDLCKISNCYKLILVGEGETKENIEEAVKTNGLSEKVIFTGVRIDVDKILSAVDLFVLPSLFEGLPIVGIEAQAAGCECLFSDTITREVDMTGQTFISIKENPEKWVDAIIKSKCRHHQEYPKLLKDRGYSIFDEGEKLKKKYYLMSNS